MVENEATDVGEVVLDMEVNVQQAGGAEAQVICRHQRRRRRCTEQRTQLLRLRQARIYMQAVTYIVVCPFEDACCSPRHRLLNIEAGHCGCHAPSISTSERSILLGHTDFLWMDEPECAFEFRRARL